MISKDRERINHILHAISRIFTEVGNCSLDDFMNSETKKESVAYNFFVIGEAANHISKEFQKAHSEIPWFVIVGMRNKIVHDYIGTNYKTIWDTAKKDLPKLENLLKSL